MNKELIGTSLFKNRWDPTNPEKYKDQIVQATINAWHALINLGKTYEYNSIMKCAFHLISLFIEDYPSKYNPYDIGITALKIAYIQLSQGKFEDPTVEDFDAFPSKMLFNIELKMLSYPYHRCFSLMETELLNPDDLYTITLDLIEEQVGDRMERRYLAKLRQNIFDYYTDLQSRPFFDQEFDPYISIGGNPSFAGRSSRPSMTSSRRIQPQIVPQEYPPYLNRDDIPSI